MKLPKSFSKIPVLVLSVLVSIFFIYVTPASAGSTLNHLSDTLSNMNGGATAVQHIIQFNITAAVGTTIQIQPSTAWGSTPATATGDYTVTVNGSSATLVSITATTTSLTLTASTTFGGVSGNTVVVTILSTAGVTNQASGSYTETVTTGGGETGVIGFETIANDQVALTANVAPTISFSLSGNALSIPSTGNLALNAESVSNTITLTLSTNASNGAVITVQDLNTNSTCSGSLQTGLYSSSACYVFPQAPAGSAAALAAVGFGVGSLAPSTGTVPAQFLATSNQVGRLTTTPQTFWSATGGVNSATVTPFFAAYATGTTPSGAYSDTATFIATATF